MSRAYRIRISETLERIVHVEDGVATQLELLPVLPKERMRELLAAELGAAGLKVEEGVARRERDGVTLTVDLATGEVAVRVTHEKELALKAEQQGTFDGDRVKAPEAEARLREAAKSQLEARAERVVAEAQKAATTKLEAELREARSELDRVVHRVTAAALKEKASQLGEIEELSEDEAEGVLTIRVRV